jgi:hypothetical protein
MAELLASAVRMQTRQGNGPLQDGAMRYLSALRVSARILLMMEY